MISYTTTTTTTLFDEDEVEEVLNQQFSHAPY